MSRTFTLIFLALITIITSNVSFLQYHTETMELASFSAIDPKTMNIKCIFINKYDVYSLEKLKKKSDDYNYISEVQKVSLHYNFCQNTKKECGKNSTMITYDQNDVSKCIRLSGSIEGEDTGKNVWVIHNETSNFKGIEIQLADGDDCQIGGERFKVKVMIECDESMKKDQWTPESFTKVDSENCIFVFKGKSGSGCVMKDYYILSAFFDKYAFIFGWLLIGSGALLAILGAYIILGTIIAVSLISLSSIFCLIVFNIFTVTAMVWVWVTVGSGLLVGLLLTYAFYKGIKFFYFLLGAVFGFLCAEMLSTLILQWITWNPEILYWIIIVVGAIFGGLLAIVLAKQLMIISTSVIGAFMVGKGISLYVGGFPNEMEIFDLIKNKEWDLLKEFRTVSVYCYLGGISLGAIVFLAVQEKINWNTPNEKYLTFGKSNKQGYDEKEVYMVDPISKDKNFFA